MPYLQRAEPTAVTIAWAGRVEGSPRVEVARRDDPDRRVIATAPGIQLAPEQVEPDDDVRYEAYDDEEDADQEIDEDADIDEGVEAEDLLELATRVGNLDEGQPYCYRLVSDRGPLTGWASLTTAPKPDADRVERFVVLGDSGSGEPAQVAIARRIQSVRMDAIMFVGDIAYRSGTEAQLQSRFFDVYDDTFQRVPVYAAIGNHDNRTERGRPFEEALVLPNNERWYSADLGDVHFVVLDTTRIGPEQAAWLDRDLAHNTRRFVIVLGHHSPYTSGTRGGNHGFRKWFVPIIERRGVDLVITGHDHHYERFHPKRDVTYVVSGGGGARLHPVDHAPGSARRVVIHHFLVVEAHDRELVVRAVDINGALIDRFEVEAQR